MHQSNERCRLRYWIAPNPKVDRAKFRVTHRNSLEPPGSRMCPAPPPGGHSRTREPPQTHAHHLERSQTVAWVRDAATVCELSIGDEEPTHRLAVMVRADLSKEPTAVKAMFDGVAARYDVTNGVVSLGLATHWR